VTVVPSKRATVTVPPDLEGELRDVRRRLEEHERGRARLIGQRDELIRRASAAGGSLREVADLVGLSHMAVRDVLRRE